MSMVIAKLKKRKKMAKNFIKILRKLPKKKKECYKYKKVNKYKNNWYRDINDNRVIQHGFFVDDYDNLQKFN